MTRVVKVGGRVLRDPALPAALAELWRECPGAACVVHGGGDEVSALQRRLGVAPTFVGGRRVTTAGDIELLRMALSGGANKALVASLAAAGVWAVGVSGEDAGLLGALAVDPERLGLVGSVTAVNAPFLRLLLNAGYLPVVSPIARNVMSPDGSALNVNADDAAAAIASALGADELWLVADVPGVIVDGVAARELDPRRAAELVTSGAASAGMAAKLEAALAAVDGGVARVRIGDAAMLADPELGTVLTPARSYA